jgi:hypothetical protein
MDVPFQPMHPPDNGTRRGKSIVSHLSNHARSLTRIESSNRFAVPGVCVIGRQAFGAWKTGSFPRSVQGRIHSDPKSALPSTRTLVLISMARFAS